MQSNILYSTYWFYKRVFVYSNRRILVGQSWFGTPFREREREREEKERLGKQLGIRQQKSAKVAATTGKKEVLD